jgi:hypothetical protein
MALPARFASGGASASADQLCLMQGSFYNLTLQWLSKHHFPPGPIHLTRTHVPTIPLYVSVGNFKLQYMESLKTKGFELYAAYGNTGTDVRAYEAAGIPKSRFVLHPSHCMHVPANLDTSSPMLLARACAGLLAGLGLIYCGMNLSQERFALQDVHNWASSW